MSLKKCKTGNFLCWSDIRSVSKLQVGKLHLFGCTVNRYTNCSNVGFLTEDAQGVFAVGLICICSADGFLHQSEQSIIISFEASKKREFNGRLVDIDKMLPTFEEAYRSSLLQSDYNKISRLLLHLRHAAVMANKKCRSPRAT